MFAENGCLRYELDRSLDDGRIRFFVETWESEANGAPIRSAPRCSTSRDPAWAIYLADFSLHRLTKVAR